MVTAQQSHCAFCDRRCLIFCVCVCVCVCEVAEEAIILLRISKLSRFNFFFMLIKLLIVILCLRTSKEFWVK